MLKKIFGLIPVMTFACSTAFATVSAGSVITLPDGSQACPYPQNNSSVDTEVGKICPYPRGSKVITLPDGGKACPIYFPQAIEAEVFIIKLSEHGSEMLKAMRPEDKPVGQFSLRANSVITKEQAELFGDVLAHPVSVITRNDNSVQPFGSRLFFGDKVPLYVQNGNDEIPFGEVNAGLSVKLDVLESVCETVCIKANVIISNVDSFETFSRVGVPKLSILAANQTQNVQFGGGFIIGGFENSGEVETEDEFMVFINVREPNDEASK